MSSIYDRWTAETFGIEGTRSRIAQMDTLEAEADRREAERIAREQAFIHWPLELPEVFTPQRSGFNVIVGNPPWDKVRFEPQQFWVSRFAGLNALGADARDERIAQLRILYPHDAETEEKARRRAGTLQHVFTTDYSLQSQHLDYAKLFVERSLGIGRRAGAIGLVLPRQFLVLVGWRALREAFFTGARTTIVQLLNRSGWVFPGVHHSYMVAIVGRQPVDQRDARICLRGGVDRPGLMRRDATIELRWSLAELREKVSETLAIPLLPTQEDAEVFARLERHPRLGDTESVFGGVVSDTPYDWTESGRREFVRASGTEADEYLLLQSRHVGMLRLDRRTVPPKAVSRTEAESLLERKWRGSRSLAEGLDSKPLSAGDAVDLYRVVYRYATQSTNSRTLIAALAPRGFLPAKGFAHSAVPLRNSARHYLALLGCLTTLTADWWTRRFVDRHLTSGVLRSIPAPQWNAQQIEEVAELVARIACESRDPFLEQFDINSDDLIEEDETRVRARIEVMYARSFGLEARDLAHIASSFNEEGAPTGLRAAIANAFDERSIR